MSTIPCPEARWAAETGTPAALRPPAGQPVSNKMEERATPKVVIVLSTQVLCKGPPYTHGRDGVGRDRRGEARRGEVR